MELNFGLGAVAVATSPGIVPEMETTNQPNGECDLLEPTWNLGPMHLSVALPYIAQTMQKGAAVVLLQEVFIRKGTAVRVR